MADFNRYRIYCETEGQWVEAYSDNEITTCPNNPAHTVTTGSTARLDSKKIVLVPDSDGQGIIGGDSGYGNELLRVLGSVRFEKTNSENEPVLYIGGSSSHPVGYSTLSLDQDVNGPVLDIDSEATGYPLVNLQPLNANTRGDLAFSSSRTADPTNPSEGDLWYNSTLHRFNFYNGSDSVSIGSYAQTITVAKSGGDYTSIKSAIDSITDASGSKPYTVYVYPGFYMEDPITLKQYVAVEGIAVGAAVVAPNNNSSPLFTAATNTSLRKIFVFCPTSEAGVKAGAGVSSVQLEDCFFGSSSTGQTAIHATGSGAIIIVEECKIFANISQGILTDSSGRVDCSSVLSYAVTSFYANGGTIWCHNSGVQYATNAIYVNNGGVFYGVSVTSESCTNALRLGSTGSNEISGEGFEVRLSTTYDCYQENATGSLNIGAARLDIEKFSITDWSLINPSFDTTVDGEERFIISKDFDSGIAERGVTSGLGQGIPYYRGMIVITTDSTATSTTDGGNLTDVSTAARSKSGSTFSFQGTSANHTILIGSELSDGSDVLRHWGLFVSQTTAAVEASAKSFIFEIWNGTAWVETKVMAVQKENDYRYSNELFIRANQEEVIRYGVELNTSWSKKTISSKNLYWCRIRITNGLTTAPVFQQFKLLPSSTEVLTDGTVVHNGLAIWRRVLSAAGNTFGESGGVTDSTIDVGSGGIPTGWTHSLKNSLMNGNGDAVYFQMPVPLGICTSMPLYVNAYFVVTTGSGNLTTIASFLPVEAIGVMVADPTGGVTPVARTAANTSTVTANAGQYDTIITNSVTQNKVYKNTYGPFYLDDFYEGDSIYLRFELDDDASNIDILINVLEIEGANWTLGKRLSI